MLFCYLNMQYDVLLSNNFSEITHGISYDQLTKMCKMSCFVPFPLTTKQFEDFFSLKSREKNF